MEKTKSLILGILCYFWSNPLRLAFLMSSSLLAGAYAFQYIGGLEPCDLCWSQRYALMAVFGLSGAGLLLKKSGRHLQKAFAWTTALALYGSSIAAGYHAGVEQKWWQGPDTCTSNGMTQATDMASLFDNMMNAKVVLCDEIPWEMFGISMAGYNFLISLGVALFVTFALVNLPRRRLATA